ncbi:hypothetical protein ThidrDRAFT_3599 [Thiorhodococcus drewsii AZ1]|uniref:Uncharacterized protein n=2 Tax=Thiorhodococcus drewsii TaxID=210408 RepID=G2E5N6_9GAMM|nr:hypothetical protein ThidrDRAFT_3599 [Thiorhodococcus drewsii AZ1]
MLFTSWEHLFDFMLEALEPAKPPPTRRSRCWNALADPVNSAETLRSGDACDGFSGESVGETVGIENGRMLYNVVDLNLTWRDARVA